MSASVFIAGPASWNSIVLVDRLPEPVPHMQFAEDSWETLGGTSAGKALSLTALGRSSLLYALSARDEPGTLVRSALERAGVRTRWGTADATERHLNLMTRRGERVSLYLAAPAETDGADDEALTAAMADADAIVLDLAAEPLRLLPLAQNVGRPIWVDVHDYDGIAEFHRPFLAAADAVFCNADRLDDPVAFLRSCIRAGATLAVCTLGADGAVAVDADGAEHRVAAIPVDVVDTNGAGDAFLAGVLDARLAGSDLPTALTAGARSASSVLRTRHLHPVLDEILG
ncbi:carbohydrate kinase family protein [Microbacterium hydrocarbonoxydans]|uniref:Sugar or nucleoside kinase, ribokinase family n=1 Tax=Microbacterium hydrocarbonoxydans TaxID=273678 RepID=A0A1H4KEK8_9MICO|nr:carbohydrate kinase family protein [Microbacterium hydrocarbonoxydans]SEB56979.1 Sugar or nucleoside kinase, ribokinase family [Microbacterium hydrocarbonoxydans]